MDENQLPFPLAFAVLLAIAGSISVWWQIAQRLRAGRAIVPHEPRSPVPWNAGHVIAVALVYIATQVVVGMAILSVHDIVWPGAAAEIGPGDASKIPAERLAPLLLSNALANLVVVGLAAALLVVTAGAQARDLGFLPWRPEYDLPLGFVAFLASLLPVYAIQLVLTQFFPSEHPVQELLTSDSSIATLLLAVFSAVIVAPLAEEFLFRGVLQGWLEAATFRLAQRDEVPAAPIESPSTEADAPPSDLAPTTYADAATTSNEANPYRSPHVERASLAGAESHAQRPLSGIERWLPIGVSSSLFALMHMGHGPDPIPLFVLAVILGYLYQQTHRLWPCIVLHMCLNSASLAILWASLEAQ
jgi:membrane protease YdiL (CAAX protease family)